MSEIQLKFELETTRHLFIKIIDEISEILWKDDFKNRLLMSAEVSTWKDDLIDKYPTTWNETSLQRFYKQISQFEEDIYLFYAGYPPGWRDEPCLYNLYELAQKLKNHLYDKLLKRFV